MTRRIARTSESCLRTLQVHLTSASSQYTRRSLPSHSSFSTSSRSRYAVAAASLDALRPPPDYIPPTKPPTARPAETRKSQLIRSYASLLRTSPLILFFQHSNLTAVEWAAVRRELKKAVEAVPAPAGLQHLNQASLAEISVLRTNMLKVAMKLVEFWDAEAAAQSPSTPRTARGPLVHDLSEAAYEKLRKTDASPDSAFAQIEPLLIGPIAGLVLPAVSPAHVAAALSILSPVPGQFPAPTKKKNPGYHDATCQSGLSKLLLVGGRVEGKVFDQAGVKWVGSIDGGLDGLRAQLVHILQGAGLGITNALEGGSRSLWLALEGRKMQMEDEAKPKTEESKTES